MSAVDREISRVADRQYGVLSIRRLRALGLSESEIRRRVADGRLRLLHRGVYAVGHSQLTIHGTWLAAVIALGPETLLSHGDGVALWELGPVTGTRVHVTVVGGFRPRRKGITVHRSRTLHSDDRAIHEAIPVTSVARTLLDYAETASPTQLQRAYERAHRLGRLDVRAIEALLERSNGRRGAPALAALITYDPALAAEAYSELERLFLDLIRRAGLPMPQVNVLVEGFLVDAYWPEAGLVVELQGYEFHSDRETFERDHAKAVRLKLAGLEFLPLTHRQVTVEASLTVKTVRSLLATGTRRGAVSR